VRTGPEAVYEMVRAIPSGRVTSYGALGLALQNRVSGLVVGNWMSRCPDDIPWWRVVAKDGRLVVFKKDVSYAITQRNLLESEGVTFEDDKVRMNQFYIDPD
jgi:methylated-DNA-protein-cysteine methyltransferase-like protein